MVPALAVKVALVAPAATVTAAGTVSSALLLLKDTVEPPVAGAFDKDSVQVELAPEPRLEGEHDNVLTAGAIREKLAVCVAPESVAVTTAVWSDVTVPAEAVNVAVAEPAATVREEGTVSAPLLLERLTAIPPAGAA